MATTIEYKIRLPKFHTKQKAFADSTAKRKVIVAGRRGGKTTAVARMAVEAMLQGRRVLEAAPTADQTNAFWHQCKNFLIEAILGGEVYKNESERILELKRNGGRIRSKTAWNADTLRGDYADLLILDEYSIMDPDTWEEVGAPMLLDNDGDAIFIFTPKRKNHAWYIYQRAVQDDTGRWAAWHFTSMDNPYLSREALEEITQDMGEEAYKQEILAEFLESEGQVFRNIAACMNAPKKTMPEQHKGHHIVAGVDWGKQADFTAISLLCTTCHCEIAHDRFNQIDYTVQTKRLKVIADRWDVALILAESNAMGEPLIEQMINDALPVEGFQTTLMSKPPLIESLSLAFERVEAQWIEDPVWTSELEAYERKVSANTGRSSYGAPEGLHDDTVIARALALQAWNRCVEPFGWVKLPEEAA